MLEAEVGKQWTSATKSVVLDIYVTPIGFRYFFDP